VKQDFVASVSGGTIYSVAFSGDGYMDGVSWKKFKPTEMFWRGNGNEKGTNSCNNYYVNCPDRSYIFYL
jgi:hypothetical protein